MPTGKFQFAMQNPVPYNRDVGAPSPTTVNKIAAGNFHRRTSISRQSLPPSGEVAKLRVSEILTIGDNSNVRLFIPYRLDFHFIPSTHFPRRWKQASQRFFASSEKYTPICKAFKKSLNIFILVLLVELLAEIFEITAEYRVPYSFHQLVKIGYVV